MNREPDIFYNTSSLTCSEKEQVLQRFAEHSATVFAMVGRSFLSDAAKTDYLHRYHDRIQAMRVA